MESQELNVLKFWLVLWTCPDISQIIHCPLKLDLCPTSLRHVH